MPYEYHSKHLYGQNSINETKKQKIVGLSNGYNYIATKDVSFVAIIYENGVEIPFSKINFKVA